MYKTYNNSKLIAIWNKGFIALPYNPRIFRKDICGAYIKYSEYGKETDYGWEVDHIKPSSHGGNDELINLRPLYWQNNRSRQDGRANFCQVKN